MSCTDAFLRVAEGCRTLNEMDLGGAERQHAPVEWGDFLHALRTRPRMLLISGSYGEVNAALVGFDHRDGAGVLSGFQEWMAARHPGLSNFAFSTLAVADVVPRGPDTDVRYLTPEQDEAATANLLDRLEEYLRSHA